MVLQEDQVELTMQEFRRKSSALDKYVFLQSLQVRMGGRWYMLVFVVDTLQYTQVAPSRREGKQSRSNTTCAYIRTPSRIPYFPTNHATGSIRVRQDPSGSLTAHAMTSFFRIKWYHLHVVDGMPCRTKRESLTAPTRNESSVVTG